MSQQLELDKDLYQRFALLHLAWDEAYGQRKFNPTRELRKYLYILAGVDAIYSGIRKSKHFYKVRPNYSHDCGLVIGICRYICDILINTHPKHKIPESLASELAEVAIELLENHWTSNSENDEVTVQSLQNVIHILIMSTMGGYEVAERRANAYTKQFDELDGSLFKELFDLIGPSLDYCEYTGSEDFEGLPSYWANDLYRNKRISDFEHMNCHLCWGPDSPEVLANAKIREAEANSQNVRTLPKAVR